MLSISWVKAHIRLRSEEQSNLRAPVSGVGLQGPCPQAPEPLKAQFLYLSPRSALESEKSACGLAYSKWPMNSILFFTILLACHP